MAAEQPCRLCGEPGRKIRLQVLPWKTECVWVCDACLPKAKEVILEMRRQLLGE